MGFKLIVQPSAEADISSAIEYYNRQKPGLGQDFFNEVRKLALQLEKYPYSCSVRYNHVRVGLVARFPFLILYVVVDKAVIILSVAHTSQNPDNWPVGTI